MNNAIKIYLRTYRKRGGLSQSEVAYLLGLKSGQTISRYERLDRKPSLETVFAFQVLFDVMPHDLYPGLYQKVENLTRRRTQALIEQLEEELDEGAPSHKLDLLLQVLERTRPRGPSL